jgi:uncharacterized protein with ParB-like and HNH nuclease domain
LWAVRNRDAKIIIIEKNKIMSEEIEFDNEEIEEIEESSVEDLAKIVSYNVANTVEVLKLKIDNEEIALKPEFQRDFVWDIKRASLFIDSLLIGLPIPSIFLGKDKAEESYIVIDGQQRLKSVYYYITGSFVSDNKKMIFALRNLKDREWDGKTFEELDKKLQRRINNAVLNTTVIEDINFRPKVVHDLFHRLNTGGMPLTDQEIRNCVYTGGFNNLLIELNKNENWRKLIGKQHVDRRLRDVELILRFFALLNGLTKYKPSMREFLSTYQEQNKNNADVIRSNKNIFDQTVSLILDSIGSDAFKLKTTLNKSVCDSIMVSVAQILIENKNISNLKNNYQKLIQDTDYGKYVVSSTSAQSSVWGRVDLARNYFLNLK